MATTDLYADEPLIRARLADQLDGIGHVGTAEELSAADLKDYLDLDSVVYVEPMAPRFDSDAVGGAKVKLWQPYQVVLQIAYAQGEASPANGGAASRAGPWLVKIVKALAGWTPDGTAKGANVAFRLAADQPDPDYTKPGRVEFVLIFERSLVI